ncbi:MULTISPECIES: arylsulfatase [unclassified Mesorhizobium]|uniref:arylsulfatase n=1 Tax=unclassified Mesorhizobium TaxID=325217 RepID=UPI0010927D24|nr:MULTISPECIES: arylsulfatase [unclassified Mesorhizobium]TGQ40537.1 arylsulfatase [Mesorhizobium sp. M4B.F.Ca.ET.214.01.1.1]TGQ60594.1 arylsulfatase [Mesorhizobium sp. M4B.F.Ca.ET.211.01.1.1]TGU36462.1 arylsulfatase [Mesorhizobium sp. M4B.F.Ca.ET.150.01.1.1]TIX17036.1 MAG: arylsulfatase [Mesorhizobium sp.]
MSNRSRHTLPIADFPPRPSIHEDARDCPATEAAAPGPTAPKGAPNVVVILLDDMGFGASSAFGGPCEMPTANRLAKGGLRYSRFHVNPMCSPTRQSLMTGRNHHAVGMGNVCEFCTSHPGNDSIRPASAAPIAEILRLNGYNTAAFGKMHQTPLWEVSPIGPFERWPTGEGFEKFYGFIGPEMNHWQPLLYDGTTPVEPVSTDGRYHLSEDVCERAVNWLEMQQSYSPDKPFFMYLPMAATHAPLHVPPEFPKKYKGKFAHGYTKQREMTLARQKEIGVIPEDADLAPWVEGFPHWHELTQDQKLLSERFMETYAGTAEHVDTQIGKVVDALDRLKLLDNTFIVYILGDNGASAEGRPFGTLNMERSYSGIDDSVDFMLEHMETIGGPDSYPQYPAGWALAMNTPYQWAKQVPSHFGCTRDGMIVHWPKGIERPGDIRQQWHHVTDIVPTILEIAGLPVPHAVHGVTQQRMDGISLAYSMNDGDASDRRKTQYFEILGNRSIYHDGWIASAMHFAPWAPHISKGGKYLDEKWQLYDLSNDWSQAHDVAEQHPEKLRELQQLFVMEASRNNVFPLDDRAEELMNKTIANRPDPLNGRTSMVFYEGMTRLTEDSILNVKNASHHISAEITLTTGASDGVIIAQGGRFGGWVLHLVDGVPTYTYNYFGLNITDVRCSDALGPGRHSVLIAFDYDGGGLGQGARVQISCNGGPVSEGRLEKTAPFIFSCYETTDIGVDLGTPVSPRYFERESKLRGGRIDSVTLTLEEPNPVGDPAFLRRLASE